MIAHWAPSPFWLIESNAEAGRKSGDTCVRAFHNRVQIFSHVSDLAKESARLNDISRGARGTLIVLAQSWPAGWARASERTKCIGALASNACINTCPPRRWPFRRMRYITHRRNRSLSLTFKESSFDTDRNKVFVYCFHGPLFQILTIILSADCHQISTLLF